MSTDENERRLGVVGIFISNREGSAPKVNALLGEFGERILGRMGLPCKERKRWVITLIIEATNDEIGALTGRLGSLPGVTVKASLSPR